MPKKYSFVPVVIAMIWINILPWSYSLFILWIWDGPLMEYLFVFALVSMIRIHILLWIYCLFILWIWNAPLMTYFFFFWVAGKCIDITFRTILSAWWFSFKTYSRLVMLRFLTFQDSLKYLRDFPTLFNLLEFLPQRYYLGFTFFASLFSFF